MIVEYNINMSGIDQYDQMISYYLSPQKSTKCYQKVFFNFIDLCLWNATYIYNKENHKKKKVISNF